jgi:hypothetical protein
MGGISFFGSGPPKAVPGPPRALPRPRGGRRRGAPAAAPRHQADTRQRAPGGKGNGECGRPGAGAGEGEAGRGLPEAYGHSPGVPEV